MVHIFRNFFVNSGAKSHVIFGQYEAILLFYLFLLIPIYISLIAPRDYYSDMFNLLSCVHLYVYMLGTLCQYCVFLVYFVASDCCIIAVGGIHPSHLISARQEWTFRLPPTPCCHRNATVNIFMHVPYGAV